MPIRGALNVIETGVDLRQGSIQPWWVRITHWINALAVVLMAMSGRQIYDASPIFPVIKFPPSITLGGWLGGALQWHFAVMWLLVVNFFVYLAVNLASGRFRRKLLLRPRQLVTDMLAVLRGRLKHDDLAQGFNWFGGS